MLERKGLISSKLHREGDTKTAAKINCSIEQILKIIFYFRSLSELSGVPGSFSAELDAMYRLYCRREYELQFPASTTAN